MRSCINVSGTFSWSSLCSGASWISARVRLPVEQPEKFTFVLNLKTAKALSIDPQVETPAHRCFLPEAATVPRGDRGLCLIAPFPPGPRSQRAAAQRAARQSDTYVAGWGRH